MKPVQGRGTVPHPRHQLGFTVLDLEIQLRALYWTLVLLPKEVVREL